VRILKPQCVKDENKWEKEQPEYPKLKQAIRKVEQKNFGLMGDWQAEHPDYKDSTTFENTEYLNFSFACDERYARKYAKGD
jgi:hypothetical protein